jgi:hypothetical protein
VLAEVALDVPDQLQVRVARGGVEGHQALEHVDGVGGGWSRGGGGNGTHAGTVARRVPGRQEPDIACEIAGLFDTPRAPR